MVSGTCLHRGQAIMSSGSVEELFLNPQSWCRIYTNNSEKKTYKDKNRQKKNHKTQKTKKI